MQSWLGTQGKRLDIFIREYNVPLIGLCYVQLLSLLPRVLGSHDHGRFLAPLN